jgi:2-phospho-L-lactate guanylyltransferase
VSGRADAAQGGWAVVIPVKALAAAKSRLAPTVSPTARLALARAFALDTIDAARAARSVGRIVVVTGEVELGAHLPAGGELLQETPGAGLGSAIELGVASVRVGGDGAVAVLLGDLPAVRAHELDAALEAAARHPLAFVRDADGTGSTLATASDGVAFEPRFGPDSAARHVAAGFVELAASDLPGLTRDVDTVDGLEIVLHHGVGDHTAEAVARLADRKGTA